MCGVWLTTTSWPPTTLPLPQVVVVAVDAVVPFESRRGGDGGAGHSMDGEAAAVGLIVVATEFVAVSDAPRAAATAVARSFSGSHSARKMLSH